MGFFLVHCMPIEYFILNSQRIKTIENVSTQINFQHLNEFAKIRSTKINLYRLFVKIRKNKSMQKYPGLRSGADSAGGHRGTCPPGSDSKHGYIHIIF